MNAFLLLQGIETLSLRMDKHASNTAKMLDYLGRITTAGLLGESPEPSVALEPCSSRKSICPRAPARS